MSLKAVVLVGGAQKGTRFRPLSLQLPKPLFPLAAEQFNDFINECKTKYSVPISYLQENESYGTAGGLLHFKDVLLRGSPKAIFVLNADICGDLPVVEMVKELDEQTKAECLILITEATREESKKFGCLIIDSVNLKKPSGFVLHYVNQPTTFVSTHISCGIYLLRPKMWEEFEAAKAGNLTQIAELRSGSPVRDGQLWFESDIFPYMAGNNNLYALHTTRWWSQTKTAAAALYANRHYLRLYRERRPERLCAENIAEIIVHPTAKIGPNVSIGAHANIGPGVRIRESIILPECVLEKHSCVLHSVIGWRSVIGRWARVEGTPIAPNPNIPFAKLDNKPLFNFDGRLNPSLTILGSDVHVKKESVVLNSIVLPYKDLTAASYKNQIIL